MLKNLRFLAVNLIQIHNLPINCQKRDGISTFLPKSTAIHHNEVTSLNCVAGSHSLKGSKLNLSQEKSKFQARQNKSRRNPFLAVRRGGKNINFWICSAVKLLWSATERREILWRILSCDEGFTAFCIEEFSWRGKPSIIDCYFQLFIELCWNKVQNLPLEFRKSI